METTNNNPAETTPAPAPAPQANAAPAAGAPAPAAARPAPTGTESTAPPAPAPVVGGMAPVTKGNVQGGWNRFAGYKPGEANKKKNDRRDGGGRGRR